MSKNNTKITLALLQQEVRSGFRMVGGEMEDIKKGMEKINTNINGVQGCIHNNELAITTIDQKLKDHIDNSKKGRFSFNLLGR